jgi:hypothetical protein
MSSSALNAAFDSFMAGPLSLDGCWNFHSRQGAPAAHMEAA